MLSEQLGISDLSSYDYIYFYDGPSNYRFIFISPDVSLDDGVYTGLWTDYIMFGNSAYQSASSHDIIQATTTSYGDIYSAREVDGELCLTYRLGNVTPIYSTVPLYDYESKDVIIEPVASSIPNPYTITYNPNLSLNMERETDLMTINSVDVTVHLNHDFIDWYIKRSFEASIQEGNNNFGLAEDMSMSDIFSYESGTSSSIDLTNCGRSESLFFITSSNVNSALYDCTYSSIYTYMPEQRYSIVDKQSGQIDGSTSTAVYANGYYPYFDIIFAELASYSSLTLSQYNSLMNKDITYTFTVDLRNINWPEIMENRNTNGLDNIDFPLECVLTSNVRFMPDGNDYFDDAFDEAYGFTYEGQSSHTNFGNLFDTFETESSYYDYFISEGWKDSPWYIYTHDFSFVDSLPDYEPLKDVDGNDIDLSGNPGNHAKNPPKPSTYQSVDQDGNLSEPRTEQEQLDYDANLKIAQNFGSQQFTDFGDLFSTSGSYFDFLTSSLKILPSWFIAIFTTFFTLLLALALIKFILD